MLIQAIAKSIEHYLDLHDEQDHDPRRKHQAMVLTLKIKDATKFVETYRRVSKKKDRCERYTSEPSPNVPANDEPLVPAEDKPLVSAEDNSLVPANDKPLVSAEDNSLVPVNDKPLVSAEDNSLVPVNDKPLVPANDKPLVPAKKILKDFLSGDIRVLVVAGKLLEGFDRKNVSVVGIARRVARKSKVLFAQFVGRAVRKFDNDDLVTTMIVSHKFYNQRENYDQFDKVTDYDNCDNSDNYDNEDDHEL